MSKYFLRNEQDIIDFCKGCTFLGTGGGGDYLSGVEALKKQLFAGREIGWMDAADMPDEDYSCMPYLMGSLAPLSEKAKDEMKRLYKLEDSSLDGTDIMTRVISEFERYSQMKIPFLVPSELGGANAATCIASAAEMGKTALDGDYSGRAVPEMKHCTPYIYDMPLLPVLSCDAWNDIAVIQNAPNYEMIERLGKMLAVAGYSRCCQCGFLLNGVNTKKAVIRGTMSDSLRIGQNIRKALEKGLDPVQAAADASHGYLICQGTLTKKEWQDKDGYYWGYHTITGEKQFSGTEIKLWFKNETQISWKNGKPFITSPDLLQIINPETGLAYTNNQAQEGMKAAVIAMRSPAAWRLPKGLAAFEPRAFGFDIDYQPLEAQI